MSPDNEELLLEHHPLLYANQNLFSGFECGDGWFNLLWRVSQKLEARLREMPAEGRPFTSQVKEKFGTLRFYLTHSPVEMMLDILEAESESAQICEECGEKGVLKQGSWLRTLCDKHHIAR